VPSIDKVNQTTREVEGVRKKAQMALRCGVVILKREFYGYETNKNGYFKLNVNAEDSRLTISFVGFETIRGSIDGITEVTVKAY
jgi:hypothetical protein